MKKIIVLILLFLMFLTAFTTFKTFSNKNIKKIEEKSVMKKEIFAMYTEQEDGSYTEYTDSNYFPSNGYRINLEMSNCVDNKGNKVEGVISGTSNKITVSSNKTAFCYLYFQKSTNLYELCKESSNIDECITNNSSKIKYIEDIWNSTLEDDGYRYVGTNPDNYICFGTDNQEECKNDTDKYMYRIIGIFEDSDGKQHLKLIKKEALNTAYAWHSDYKTDTEWEDSDLYKGINGDYFLTNPEYTYMQDSSWNSLIETWDYTATNTKTDEMFGIYYYYNLVKTIYLHEMNKTNKANFTCYYNSNILADCSIGEWTTISSKIALMYASDYLLSLGERSLEYESSGNDSILRTGWMHLSKNDSVTLSTTAVVPPSNAEWTISRYGRANNDLYRAISVFYSGRVSSYNADIRHSVRPVFYLKSDTKITGGDGTIEKPFIILN